MKAIELHGEKAAGRVALIDDDDYELVSQYRWHVYERPKRRVDAPAGLPYARASRWEEGKSKKILMHKLITGYSRTDHVDHYGLNNQRTNLRPATNAQNSFNSRAKRGSSSAYKGVSWRGQLRKWQATIKVGDEHRYLGLFADEVDAAKAYDRAAKDAFGDYAYLNLVPR